MFVLVEKTSFLIVVKRSLYHTTGLAQWGHFCLFTHKGVCPCVPFVCVWYMIVLTHWLPDPFRWDSILKKKFLHLTCNIKSLKQQTHTHTPLIVLNYLITAPDRLLLNLSAPLTSTGLIRNITDGIISSVWLHRRHWQMNDLSKTCGAPRPGGLRARAVVCCGCRRYAAAVKMTFYASDSINAWSNGWMCGVCVCWSWNHFSLRWWCWGGISTTSRVLSGCFQNRTDHSHCWAINVQLIAFLRGRKGTTTRVLAARFFSFSIGQITAGCSIYAGIVHTRPQSIIALLFLFIETVRTNGPDRNWCRPHYTDMRKESGGGGA